MTLQRTDRHARPKQLVGSGRLGNVALLGRRAVGIDVADVFRRQARISQCQLHGAAHGFVVRSRGMLAVAIRTETHDFRNDVRTAGLRMLKGLQHKSARAFADDKSVAADIKWARRRGRRIVPSAGGKQRVEYGSLGRTQFLRAARDHDFLAIELDGLVGITNALTARGARTRRRNNAPLRAEIDRDVDRRRVRHHAQISCRIDGLQILIEQHTAELAHRICAAGG